MRREEWYYLSDMAISPSYGGGLTLQRILQDDLQKFDKFFYTTRFASTLSPTIPSLTNRVVNLDQVIPFQLQALGFLRQQLISRLAYRIKLNQYLEFKINQYQEASVAKFETDTAKYLSDKINNSSSSSCLIVPQTREALAITDKMYKHRSFSYATWIMDDHWLVKNNDWYYTPTIEESLGKHLNNARKIFVISPEMSTFYKDRFGVESSVLFSPADPIAPPHYEVTPSAANLRICYFGALWDWQREALEMVIPLLSSLNATLHIYSYHNLPDSMLSERVYVNNPVTSHEVLQQMQNYDAVLIPVSFDLKSRGLAEFNISTKMSECLASGIATIVIAPEYAAMTRFYRRYGGGIIINDLSDDHQIAQIESLRDPFAKRKLLNDARKVSEQITSVRHMRQVWEEGWHKLTHARG